MYEMTAESDASKALADKVSDMGEILEKYISGEKGPAKIVANRWEN